MHLSADHSTQKYKLSSLLQMKQGDQSFVPPKLGHSVIKFARGATCPILTCVETKLNLELCFLHTMMSFIFVV